MKKAAHGLDATVRDALVAFEKQISARDRSACSRSARAPRRWPRPPDRSEVSGGHRRPAGPRQGKHDCQRAPLPLAGTAEHAGVHHDQREQQGGPRRWCIFRSALAAPAQDRTSLVAAIELPANSAEVSATGQSRLSPASTSSSCAPKKTGPARACQPTWWAAEPRGAMLALDRRTQAGRSLSERRQRGRKIHPPAWAAPAVRAGHDNASVFSTSRRGQRRSLAVMLALRGPAAGDGRLKLRAVGVGASAVVPRGA